MKKIVLLLIVSISLFGCSQDAIDDELSDEDMRIINEQGSAIIDNFIDEGLNGTLLDSLTLCNQFKAIDGVVAAAIDPTGTSVSVQLKDGTYNYFLLVTGDNDVWFDNSEEEQVVSSLLTKGNEQNYTVPLGDKKALILAPFAYQAKDIINYIDYNSIYNKLSASGFQVDSFMNTNATIERFRGDYLSQFDVIIINTHGGTLLKNGQVSTTLVTRTLYTEDNLQKLSKLERDMVLCTTVDKISYIGIAHSWLDYTTTNRFNNSWVFVCGCNTTLYDDLYSEFIALGVEGFNGFNFTISFTAGNNFLQTMVSQFTSGKTFQEASEYTFDHTSTGRHSSFAGFFFTLFGRNKNSTKRFDAKQYNEDIPFYLIVPEGYQKEPSVQIIYDLEVTTNSASFYCGVDFSGAAKVIAKGVCWSTTPNPTILNPKTTDGIGTDTYYSTITGLSPNTTYYVRAYATNAYGTAYSEDERTFRTNPGEGGGDDTLTDSRDGNVYKTVTIGDQLWMAENLAYLPAVSPSSEGGGGGMGEYSPPSGDLLKAGPSAAASDTEPRYYVYEYSGTNVEYAKATTNYQTYGVLYNWPAAMTACPSGWHVPSDAEWTQLEEYLIANAYNYDGTTEGNKIAISLASTNGWSSSTNTGTIGNSKTAYDAFRNKSGFSALPGGCRDLSGAFSGIEIYGGWWGSTQKYEDYAWRRSLYYFDSYVDRNLDFKGLGFSVRCMRD